MMSPLRKSILLILLTAVGLALLAPESAALARTLDRAEIRLRRLGNRFRRR